MTDPDAGRLTHLDEDGRATMVDVTTKDVTVRTAEARGHIIMAEATFQRILQGRTDKGDPLQIAELAGIMGGKRTADLIPLCHALPGASVTVRAEPDAALPGIVVHAEARYAGRTGVEMEALTAVGIALLTVYDMVKAVDRGMRIADIRLVRKAGGRSGTWPEGDQPRS